MMPILIPAAGASARMRGVDKLLQDIDGVPLLRRQAVMALDVSEDVHLALPPRPHARYRALDGLPVQQVEVVDADVGMSASLRTLIGTLNTYVTHAMLLLGDLPDITGDDLRQVMEACQAHPDALIWRGATPSGVGGHPMIIARALFDGFQSLTGEGGGHSIVTRHADRVHLVPFSDGRARRDLDTPEDWATWRAARSGDVT